MTGARKLAWPVLTTLLLATFVTLPANTANAWIAGPCKYRTSGLKWKDSTSRTTYSNSATAAIQAWHATPTPITFTKATTGANLTVTDANFGSEEAPGLLIYYDCPTGYHEKAPTAYVNRHFGDGYISTKRKSVYAHEIGHALGLDHTDALSCPNMELMRPDPDIRYDRCLISGPQAGDITGINVLY